jgi:hypothetical protein
MGGSTKRSSAMKWTTFRITLQDNDFQREKEAEGDKKLSQEGIRLIRPITSSQT